MLVRVKDARLRLAPLRGRLRRSLTRPARAGRGEPVGTKGANKYSTLASGVGRTKGGGFKETKQDYKGL